MVAAALSSAGPARADHHLMKIREVFAKGSAQYVELQMYSGDQHLVQGHQITFFNDVGTQVGTWTFSQDAASGTTQSSVLIGTVDADALFSNTFDDMADPIDPFPAAGGLVCFRSITFGNIDCVSWGNYSSQPSGSGNPFQPMVGIPNGAAIEREIGGNGLQNSDDTNDSRSDFDYVDPSPRNNSGSMGTPTGGTLAFGQDSYPTPEEAGSAAVSVNRNGDTGDAAGAVDTIDVTANAGSDYTALSDHAVSWADQESGAKAATVTVTADSDPEPHETLLVRVDVASGSVVLGDPPVATVTITDNDDSTAPETSITKPRQRGRYRAAQVRKLTGSATDDGGLDEIELALRQRIRGGGCKWWNGNRFVNRACSSKLFSFGDLLDGTGEDTWSNRLAKALRPSVGTSIANYTLFARSLDQQSNQESTFEVGRNANTFEVT
jgi:hypothetical protein